MNPYPTILTVNDVTVIIRNQLGVRQAVRQRILIPSCVGSIPTPPTKILLKGESRWTVVRLVGR